MSFATTPSARGLSGWWSGLRRVVLALTGSAPQGRMTSVDDLPARIRRDIGL